MLVVDDVLATGGTARAAVNLVQRLGSTLHAAAFLIELDFLKGRDKLTGSTVFSVLQVLTQAPLTGPGGRSCGPEVYAAVTRT